MTLKWIVSLGPHAHFSNQEELIPINFFIHNYIIHKKNQKFEIVSKILFTHSDILRDFSRITYFLFMLNRMR